eukprot:CAMPEP_0202970738 /NCGR_PEP_ID=MMETSP1396-20130829/19419_1 /ASSEMBLY_ACC=CAM_ASM_000872 /TAXON_ID= /ORGANISM="Pseudokeronopsis sp., Strain Brazil" /LENGTH=56 /DNA_ID=CAMNT_0049699449 /DNA_START=19 /DNA_END=189 /DNA_ORIENTATION=+
MSMQRFLDNDNDNYSSLMNDNEFGTKKQSIFTKKNILGLVAVVAIVYMCMAVFKGP